MLGALTPDDVDMRTVVIVGSSHTQVFTKSDGWEWVYTPRWYGENRRNEKQKAGNPCLFIC